MTRLLSLLPLLLFAAQVDGDAPQSTAVPPAVLGEGALENDVFLPTSQAAARRLSQGDAAFANASTQIDPGDPGVPTGIDPVDEAVEAFEAWRNALLESAPGEAVPGAPSEAGIPAFLPDPDATAARRTEAVEYAVLRRLAALGPRYGSAWARRFGPIALRELAAAGSDAEALTGVEHRNPATYAAVRAALTLGDLLAEIGDPSATQWLERAEIHRRTADLADAALASAIARRRAVFDPPPAPAGAPSEELWRTAHHIAPIATIPLAAPPFGPDARSERGIRYGLVFLADGRSVIQMSDRCVIVGPEGGATSIDLEALLGPLEGNWLPPFNDLDAEWPLWPASDGAAIVLVAGRSQGSRGNALLCIEPPSSTPSAGGAKSARLRWAYVDDGFAGADGARQEVAALLGPGLWGFEPGPVFDGTIVLVQARQWNAEAGDEASLDERQNRGWCLALDLATGLPRWKRLLATGPDLRASRTDARLAARGVASPAAPLAVCAGRVLAATELGAVALLETCDGRPCWTLATRRRAGAANGQTAPVRAPIPVLAGRLPAEAAPHTLWIVAPADSDRVYRLHGNGLIGAQGLFARAPAPREPHSVIEGGDERGLFLSLRAGQRTSLALIDPTNGRRTAAFQLAREEEPGRGVLLSATRAYLATSRGLCLFDRERDFELLDFQPLATGGDTRPGAAVTARADRVLVLDRRALSIFRAE